MSNVEGLIGQLLLRHNCVIIPSFGGFVAKQVSAKIDFEKGTMFPPSKSLLFNRQLVNNDGLLINEYASTYGISFDQASTELKEVTDHWKNKLKNGDRIEIDKVGKLFLDAENNICFEQDRFYNLLLESFGLSKVHFLSEEDVQIVESTIELIERRELEMEPLKKEETIKVVPTQEEEKEEVAKVVPITAPVLEEEQIESVAEHPVITEKKKRNFGWRYVAAACLLPIAFYSFWIPLKTDVLESGVISIKDFNPFYEAPQAVYVPADQTEETLTFEKQLDLDEKVKDLPEGATVYSVKYADDHYVAVELPKKEVVEVIEELEKPAPEIQEEVISANAMHYIVGAFGNKSNAKKLVRELRSEGLDAKIVGYANGMHRVAAGSAISEEAMDEIAKKSKQLGHPGWVLR